MRAAGVVVAVAAVALLAGCGTSAGDEVRAKIVQFSQAAARHDYGTICQQVLATALLERLASAGVSCEGALQIDLGGVQDASLSIGRISVSGHTASVIALSTARNQQAALETIELVRESQGWRVSSLGGPVNPKTLR